jgi:hypothetical protein
MTEEPIRVRHAQPEDAERVWKEQENPTCRTVREQLVKEGFTTPSFKTINNWRNRFNWSRKVRPPKLTQVRQKAAIRETMDMVAKAITGDENAKAPQLVEVLTGAKDEAAEAAPPAANAAKTRFEGTLERLAAAETPEQLMLACAIEAHKTALILFGALGAVGETLMSISPEAAGKAFQSVSAGLESANAPVQQLASLRESLHHLMKPLPAGTVEILPPESEDEEEDPLAVALRAHAAA